MSQNFDFGLGFHFMKCRVNVKKIIIRGFPFFTKKMKTRSCTKHPKHRSLQLNLMLATTG